MKRWAREAFTCRPVLPPALLAELSQLQSHPGYDVTVTNGSPACRFEASRHGADTGIPAGRAP